MTGARENSGFTLIEIIVVVAIIAIMAGIMVPMTYRVWQSSDLELTRERMRELKIALVGDARMVQNGVRTSFGYIGDFGTVPATLADLIPYLPAGFDPAKYNLDAWNNAIIYDPTPSGQYAAFLRSKGPDGVQGTADDINETTDTGLQIYQSEVAPLSSVQGNLNVLFQSPPVAAKSYYVRLSVKHRSWVASQLLPATGCCSGIVSTSTNTANIQVNYTQSFACSLTSTVPEGTVSFSPVLYNDSNCAGSATGTGSEITANIGSSTLFTNLQIQSVAP